MYLATDHRIILNNKAEVKYGDTITIDILDKNNQLRRTQYTLTKQNSKI